MTSTAPARACRTLTTLTVITYLMTGCVAQPMHSTPTLVLATDAPAVTATYTHAEAAFAVTSRTEAAGRAMVPALQSAAIRFSELFGDDAPRIVVMVDDSSHAEVQPPRGRPTELLQRSLTARVASTWIVAYANAWSNTFEDGGYATTPTHGAIVPAWFQVATVQTLANADASAQATRRMQQQLEHAPSLASLFVSTSRWSESPLYQAQATSVLDFLRNEFGMDPTHDLLVPLLGGASMKEIMGGVDSRVSLDVLDATWRQWVTKGKGYGL